METTNTGGLQVMMGYNLLSEQGQLIALTGGKCNKPPRLATVEVKRRWSNALAKRRRFEHKQAKEIGVTRKEWKQMRLDNLINTPVSEEL